MESRSSRSTSPLPPEKPARRRGLLKEQLELEKVKGKDGRVRYTLKPFEDTLTFDKGFYVFIRALQLLKSHNEGVVVVGLAGASGSGKTAFSEKVKNFIPGVALISMDNYNDATKLIDSNFDDPRLTDYDLLLQNLADLKRGQAVQMPVYDFKESRRAGYRRLDVPTSRIVIIEGIYALSERLRPLLDLRVSITGGVHFDLVKRVLRDVSRSGQGPEEIIQQITDTVYPMYKAFIEPDLQMAQLKIHNAFNPFTGFMNATYILKSARPVTHDTAMQVLAEGERQVRVRQEAEIYDIYLLPPDEDPENCQTWLRMRNRDGRYSLMFEEWVTEGPFVISPRITFEVSVRILGGLMALGYSIGGIMKRRSQLLDNGEVTVKFDDIANLGSFIQIQGKDRDRVMEVAQKLGLEGSFIPRSYIEQVQLAKLTSEFSLQHVKEDLRSRFGAGGQAILDDILLGSSPPPKNLFSQKGPALSTSAPIAIHRPIPSPLAANRSVGSSNGLAQQLRTSSPNSPANGQPSPPGPQPSAGDEGPARPPSSAAANHTAANWVRLHDRLEDLAQHTGRIGSMQLQLDAVLHQYKTVTEHLTALEAALHHRATEAAAAAPAQQASSSSALVGSSPAALLAAGAVSVALGAALGVLLSHRASR